MPDNAPLEPELVVKELEQAAARVGFMLSSDPLTGLLLRTLVASKPGGEILEIGTGVGVGTTWLLSGLDQSGHLTTLDRNADTTDIAKRFLGDDPRLTFQLMDGFAFIENCRTQQRTFDLIFADSHPGKFAATNETLDLLKKGGIYIVDDLDPQPKWEDGHDVRVKTLLETLEQRSDLFLTRLHWSTGLLVAVKK